MIAPRMAPCGCVRGQYLCPEAAALWAAVESAGERQFEEAHQAFKQHYRMQGVS